MIAKVTSLLLFTFCVVAACSPNCRSGVDSLKGNEAGFWSNHALVVARVAEIHHNGVNGTLVLSLQAVARTETLLPTTVSVSYTVAVDSALGPKEQDALVKDGLVLAVLGHDNDGWNIDGNLLGFMPNHAGVLAVKNMDDPAISSILDKLKQLCSEK